MKAIVQCPNGHRFHCDAAHLGRRVKCPKAGCEARFHLAGIMPPEAPPEARIETYSVESSPLAAPTSHANASAAPAVEIVDFVSQVRKRLTELDAAPARWGRGLAVLALSLGAFIALGAFAFNLEFILVIVVVLFIHEMGHLVAMLLFGYRNVQMFFIPLFGAAVSGRKSLTLGWQEAIVALAGPVPGIVIGLGLYVASLQSSTETLGNWADLFVILNALQLIPVLPLDGGCVVNDLLFTRSSIAEAVFRALAGCTLLLIALALGSIFIGILGVFMLLRVPAVVQLNRLAADLRSRLPEGMYGEFDALPEPVRNEIIRTVQRTVPGKADVNTVAEMVRQVWQRLNRKPPSALPTLALLLVYFVAVVAAIALPVTLAIMVMSGAIEVPETSYFGAVAAEFKQGWEDASGGQSPWNSP